MFDDQRLVRLRPREMDFCSCRRIGADATLRAADCLAATPIGNGRKC